MAKGRFIKGASLLLSSVLVDGYLATLIQRCIRLRRDLHRQP